MTERQDEEKKPFSPENGESELDFEPEEELGSISSLQAKLKKARAELDQCKKERTEYLDGWQRCKADAVNTKKETEARAARSAEVLREALVHDIIPALDSFDMASGSEAWADIGDGWKTGMEAVRDQLIDALRRHGIDRFGKVGDTFDPVLHEVGEAKEDVAGASGSIVSVLRKGYRAGERILRPAHVVIKK